MRKSKVEIKLTISERQHLEETTCARIAPYRGVQRSRFVLLAPEGMENKTIAREIGLSRSVVVKLQPRFAGSRLEGLEDGPRSGKKPRYNQDTERSKLSKRHRAPALTEYREQGYLPEAMINFLALLGWLLDDKTEIISREDLIKHFSLERVSKTAAIFNYEKLQWMNGVYIRKLTPVEFVEKTLPFLERGLPAEVKRPLSFDYVRRVLPLAQDCARTLAEVSELTEYFFTEKLNYDSKLLLGKDMTVESTINALKVARERLEKQVSFDTAALEAMLRSLAEELKLKAGQLFGALRTAVSRRTATPPLFQMMAVWGKERTLARINDALKRLSEI